LDRNGLSVSTETACRFEPKSPVGNSEICTQCFFYPLRSFEREVIGERICDKIAASKRKGMWMGGVQPLGYRTQGPQARDRRQRGGDRTFNLPALPNSARVRLLKDQLAAQGGQKHVLDAQRRLVTRAAEIANIWPQLPGTRQRDFLTALIARIGGRSPLDTAR
jgi:DNA invertase Pin-like site-specific DNA recombinase